MKEEYTNILREDLVSVVMRTVGGRSKEIRRALASLAASHHRPIEVVVVYQGGDSGELKFLQTMLAQFSNLNPLILQNNVGTDRRAENLNLGWAAAHGRYIGFLDDDDTLEPEHLSKLLDALRTSGRAWAYSQTTLRRESRDLSPLGDTKPFWRARFSLTELWTDNFLPIHCFLVDRKKLVPELKEHPFCEELDRSEDWDFLIRLGFFHEPESVCAFTCNYHVVTGSRNTNLSLTDDDSSELQESNRLAWIRCKNIIEQHKIALIQRVWWAKEIFSGAVSFSEDPRFAYERSGFSGLRRRVARTLRRRFDRLVFRIFGC